MNATTVATFHYSSFSFKLMDEPNILECKTSNGEILKLIGHLSKLIIKLIVVNTTPEAKVSIQYSQNYLKYVCTKFFKK